jgi:superfamily I DNA/RNA helicase
LEDVEEDTLLPPGALRSLQFSENKHVLLCEELKHLYTAITRAKNNVVIFDQNPTKRAPFYHYLRRCGLARDVRQSLLVVRGCYLAWTLPFHTVHPISAPR